MKIRIPRTPDLDLIYQWVTLLIIPIYVLSSAIRSEIFTLYFVLFVLQVIRQGYRRTGLEVVTLAALAGLAASAIGAHDPVVMRNVLRVARILALPIMMAQYRPIPRLIPALSLLFGVMAVYGIVRLTYFPLITGYAMDRPYSFSDFFMHSSVIAVSGYLFSLVFCFRAPGMWRKLAAVAGALAFLYLIVRHQVRASYLSVLIMTPLIVLIELPRSRIRWHAVAALSIVMLAIGAVLMRSDVPALAGERLAAITDLQDGSTQGRLVIWRRALEVFRESPLKGIGYRRFNRGYLDLGHAEFEWAFAHAHNEILGMLAETGIVGTAGWIAYKLVLFVFLIKRRRRAMGAFLLYLLAAFEIHLLFEHYLYERIAYIYVFMLLGLGWNQLTAPEPGDGNTHCAADLPT